MLLSGLWKLAAMAGVIGVGLVAVYQAQKGMDNTTVASTPDSSVADASDPQAPRSTDQEEDSPSLGTASPAAGAAAPEQAEDPFANLAFAKSASKPPSATVQKPVADEAPEKTFSETPTSENSEPNPFEAFATSGGEQEPVQTASSTDDDQFDLDKTPAATKVAPKVGSAAPARLPDDLDALETEILERAGNSRPANTTPGDQVPAVTSVPIKSKKPAKVAFDGDYQYLPAGPEKLQPKLAPPSDPVEADPFAATPAESELPAQTPAKEIPDVADDLETPSVELGSPSVPTKPSIPNGKAPQQNSDPFSDEPASDSIKPVEPKQPVAAPKSGSPVQLTNGSDSDKSGAPEELPDDDLSSPFAPNEDLPAKSKPETSPFGDLEAPAETPKPRTLPRIPTEIPDPLEASSPDKAVPDKAVPDKAAPDKAAPDKAAPDESAPEAFPGAPEAFPGFPDEPEPAKQPRSVPEPGRTPPKKPAQDAPKLTDEDLVGDGTINSASPRGVQHARVTIEKIAPQQAVLGEPLIYSVIVKNIGSIDAHQVVVEDRIPKGTELTGTAPRAEMVEKKLMWKIGTLKAGEEKKISIRVIPRQEGAIGSVARVSFATEVAAEILIAAPQLAFQVKAPRQVRMGETIELTFLLKNTGNAAATNVSVRDLVPSNLMHEAAADIECPVGKLGPNETREIALSVTAVKPGKGTNRAILTGDGGISQELETGIEVIGEQLVLTRTGQTKIYVDRPVQFTNNVRNDGNAEVASVRVSEVVPAGMEFVAASDGGRFDPVQRAIYWDLAGLPAGAETSVSSKLIAKSPGIQQAKISASGPAGSTAVIKSDVDVVGRPELQIETVSRTGVVAVGDRLTSKIQLKNHGSASARNVSLQIRLPRELKLVEVRGSEYTVRDNLITFQPIAAISPRETAGFELIMEAVSEADAQMNLEITADHLTKPARRSETVQIAAEVR